MAASEWIEIGIVLKPHGVRGAFKVRLHNPDSKALDRCETLCLEAQGRRLYGLSVVGQAGGELVLGAEAITTRDDAEALRGACLLMPREALVIDEGEHLYSDLEGCVVQDGERPLGVVQQVFRAGASDVLVVVDDQGVERMIPLVEDWVVRVDVTARRIEVRDSQVWDD